MLRGSAKDLWVGEIRAKAQTVFEKCRKDPELTRSLESMILKVDSDIAANTSFADRIEPVLNVIASESYYINAHRSTSTEEINMIKDLSVSLSSLHRMAAYATRLPAEDEVEKTTKERLPNTDVDIKSVYGPSQNKRERLL